MVIIDRYILIDWRSLFDCTGQIVRGQFTTLDEAEQLLTCDEDVFILNRIKIQIPVFIRGIFWSCVVGIFGGSILAPMHYIPQAKQSLVLFLPSFGLGALLTSPVLVL